MRGLQIILMGLVGFVIVQQIVPVMITGTDSGSVMLRSLLGLSVAVGAIVAALFLWFKPNR